MKNLKIQPSKNSKAKTWQNCSGGGIIKIQFLIFFKGDMWRTNSFNTQPEPLKNKPDSFNNITYDKAGTSLDNIVGDLRDYHKEMSFVVVPNSHKDTLRQRLLNEGSAKHEPISSILKMDNDNYIVTYAGYMGLVETNRDGKARLADLIDMSDKDEDFNPYKGSYYWSTNQPTGVILL